MQTSVVISPPSDPSIDALLRDALGTDLPAPVSWARRGDGETEVDDELRGLPGNVIGARLSERRFADRVVLPGHRIYADATRQDIGRLLPLLLGPAGRYRERAFVCAAFSSLVDNALIHGVSSPVGAVASIVCDPRQRQLELVVCDLGQGVPSASMADFTRDLEQPRASEPSSLTALVASAQKRELSTTFRFITSGYYIECDVLAEREPGDDTDAAPERGHWRSHRIGLLPGFTAGVEIRW